MVDLSSNHLEIWWDLADKYGMKPTLFQGAETRCRLRNRGRRHATQGGAQSDVLMHRLAENSGMCMPRPSQKTVVCTSIVDLAILALAVPSTPTCAIYHPEVINHCWLVVCFFYFYFSIYWEKSSQLTHIFQRGWSHQPVMLNRSSRTPPVLGSWWFDFTSTSLRAFLPGPAMTWRRVDWWFRNVDWTMVWCPQTQPEIIKTWRKKVQYKSPSITWKKASKHIYSGLLRFLVPPQSHFFGWDFLLCTYFPKPSMVLKTLEIHPNFSPEAALSKLPGQSKARVSQVFFIEPLMDHGYHSYVKLPEGSRGYKQQHHVGLLMEYAMLGNSICSKMGKKPTNMCLFKTPHVW